MGSFKMLFNNKITISRMTKSKDSYGGFTTEWVKRSWDIPCRVYTSGGNSGGYKITIQGQDYMVTDRLLCDKSVDIESGDRVQESNTNDIYLVIRTKKVYTLKRLNHIECLLSKIEGEIS